MSGLVRNIVRNIEIKRAGVCIELRTFFLSQSILETRAIVSYPDGKNYIIDANCGIFPSLGEYYTWNTRSLKTVKKNGVQSEFNFKKRDFVEPSKEVIDASPINRSITLDPYVCKLGDEKVFIESPIERKGHVCLDGYLVSFSGEEMDVKYFDTIIMPRFIKIPPRPIVYQHFLFDDRYVAKVEQSNKRRSKKLLTAALDYTTGEELTAEDVDILGAAFKSTAPEEITITEKNFEEMHGKTKGTFISVPTID